MGQVSLLDSPALERDAGRAGTTPDSNSLASKLASENWLAQYYVNSLLGQIACCDTPDTLERYPQSATGTCCGTTHTGWPSAHPGDVHRPGGP